MTILRWALVVTAVAASLGGAFLAWVYMASEAHMRSFPTPPPFTTELPDDAAAIARGERLVNTRGCRGCHGDALEGQLMWGTAVAPNLAMLARSETPATIEAAIRHGIGRDGRALYSMPSYNFVHLTDADVAAIIAYLRSAPVAESRLPRARLPFEVRLAIALGQDAAMPAWLDRVPPLQRQADTDPRVARGEYLAMTSCNECHGFNLRGEAPWEGSAPDLVVIGAYSEAEFRHLMRTGEAAGGRELSFMGPVARGRFVHWTDQEVGDLFAFLSDLSARAIRDEE